jgi:hypothetical protein
MGQTLELLLLVLEAGDVGEQGDVTAGFAFFVFHGGQGQSFGIDFAIFAPVPDLA